MGRPKPDLVLGTEAMLIRQARLLCHVCRQVAIVGWRHAPGAEPAVSPPAEDVALLPDALPGRGPLGGIYTALCRTRTEFNLVLGCDLPFVDAPFLHYLSRVALASEADVTVPESHERTCQPLCAVYRRRLLPLVRARLAAGKNKITSFYPLVVHRIISWPEIARAGFRASVFVNMNTPEEYELAKRRAEACRIT
jgi:molybdenum cofactor guanylyltransferase